jgi:hypothetical protein
MMRRQKTSFALDPDMGYRIRKKSGFLAPLIALVWVLCLPAVAAAQQYEDLYLLDFHADGYRLAESVPAYGSADTYLIDFALFLEAVEFPIEREGELWSGWFHSQDRHFVWRMDLGIVQVGDRHGESVEEHEWLEAYDGTFVSVGTLENWFNMELHVDPRTQVLTIHSDEPLPFQLWRERMLAKYRYRPGDRSDAEMIVPDQYHWATTPLVDLSTQFRTQKQGGDRNSSGSTSLAVGMDLLKHSVVYTGGISGSSDDSSVSTINRYPAGRSSNLGQATIAGDAPPGWEVELYRNGALIAFATVGADGRYFFPDQEVPFGENIFVAKLFGPQGQTREDRQTFWGGGTDLAEGDYDFSISHIDFDRFLLDGGTDARAEQRSTGRSRLYANRSRLARARWHFHGQRLPEPVRQPEVRARRTAGRSRAPIRRRRGPASRIPDGVQGAENHRHPCSFR